MSFHVISLVTILYTIIVAVKAGDPPFVDHGLIGPAQRTRLWIPEKIYKKRGSYLDKHSKDIEIDGRTKIPQAGAPLNSGGFGGGFNSSNNGKYLLILKQYCVRGS